MRKVGKGRGHPKQDKGLPRIGLGELFLLDKTSGYPLTHTGLEGTPSPALSGHDQGLIRYAEGGMSLAVRNE